MGSEEVSLICVWPAIHLGLGSQTLTGPVEGGHLNSTESVCSYPKVGFVLGGVQLHFSVQTRTNSCKRRWPQSVTPSEGPAVDICPEEVVHLIDGPARRPAGDKGPNQRMDYSGSCTSPGARIHSGWVASLSSERVETKRYELSAEEGCLLWGVRGVIPPPGRKHMLHELHQAHPGIERMKGLARALMWWPSMDAEVETTVN